MHDFTNITEIMENLKAMVNELKKMDHPLNSNQFLDDSKNTLDLVGTVTPIFGLPDQSVIQSFISTVIIILLILFNHYSILQKKKVQDELTELQGIVKYGFERIEGITTGLLDQMEGDIELSHFHEVIFILLDRYICIY
jgi:hypothetical protein